MDLNESLFSEEDIVDQCDQIRAIASKVTLTTIINESEGGKQIESRKYYEST